MKKLFLGLLIIFTLFAGPALAATATKATTKPATTPAKPVTTPAAPAWKPIAPEGYSPITWAKAPGIASFFKAPVDNGAIDFLTKIYLPQNQIVFVKATSTPVDLKIDPSFDPESITPILNDLPSSNLPVDLSAMPNLSFQRLGAEIAKTLTPNIKFLWDAPFFNVKPISSDLSLAVKYTAGTSTIISSGSRSTDDLALPRKMLLINNQTATATIQDFDSTIFMNKNNDLGLEGFAPTVVKTDSASPAASRLFLGVSNDGKELDVYCSQLATTQEASDALTAAGISPDNQLEADGGGSASCGYNLPGQYFVEPTRTLPLMMGAETILTRGKVIAKTMNVRNGPTTKNPIITTLPQNTPVKVYEEKSGWYKIGADQWILKTLIK